jgi:hypothetical protein
MPTTSTTTTTDQPRSPLSNEIFLGFCFAIGCATLLAIVGNYHESTSTQTSTPEMFRLSNALVTGALGFFAGRASAWAQQRSGSTTLAQSGTDPVPPNPSQPVGPA